MEGKDKLIIPANKKILQRRKGLNSSRTYYQETCFAAQQGWFGRAGPFFPFFHKDAILLRRRKEVHTENTEATEQLPIKRK